MRYHARVKRGSKWYTVAIWEPDNWGDSCLADAMQVFRSRGFGHAFISNDACEKAKNWGGIDTGAPVFGTLLVDVHQAHEIRRAESYAQLLKVSWEYYKAEQRPIFVTETEYVAMQGTTQ